MGTLETLRRGQEAVHGRTDRLCAVGQRGLPARRNATRGDAIRRPSSGCGSRSWRRPRVRYGHPGHVLLRLGLASECENNLLALCRGGAELPGEDAAAPVGEPLPFRSPGDHRGEPGVGDGLHVRRLVRQPSVPDPDCRRLPQAGGACNRSTNELRAHEVVEVLDRLVNARGTPTSLSSGSPRPVASQWGRSFHWTRDGANSRTDSFSRAYARMPDTTVARRRMKEQRCT